MKLVLMSAVALLTMGVASANAGTNLVLNGSFENGFADWHRAGFTGDGYPESIITYGSATPYPTGAFGEAVPAESAGAGSHGAYFVSDKAFELLTQTVFLKAGEYTTGFSYFVPNNGAANVGDATLTAFVGGNITTFDVDKLVVGTWENFSTTIDITKTGNYVGGFSFITDHAPSKDIVIDQAFITSAVPEPGVWIMMLGGLGIVGGLLRVAHARRREDECAAIATA